MVSDQERSEIVKAGNEVERLKALYEAAIERFDALVEGRRAAPVAIDFGAASAKSFKRKGKAPDPKSLNQRVLAEIARSPTPVAIKALAVLLNATEKQIRHAIVYHQKRGVLVHAGLLEQFTMKDRMVNENGAHAVGQS